MTGRTLVLLRHGRTAWNHEGRVQGQLDVGLDEVGHGQASAAAASVAALRPVALWCSDLARARETVAPLADLTGLPVTYDKRLRELAVGDLEGLRLGELEARDPAAYRALVRGRHDDVPGAEPTVEARERMTEALGELVAALGPGETGVAVSHGGVIRIATVGLLGWPHDQLHDLRGLHNCHRAELVEDPHDGRLRLRAYNRPA